MVLRWLTASTTQGSNDAFIQAAIRIPRGKNFIKIIEVVIEHGLDLIHDSTDVFEFQITSQSKTAIADVLDTTLKWKHYKVAEDTGANVSYKHRVFRPMVPRFSVEDYLYVAHDSANTSAQTTTKWRILVDVSPQRY